MVFSNNLCGKIKESGSFHAMPHRHVRIPCLSGHCEIDEAMKIGFVVRCDDNLVRIMKKKGG
jgi:hypothetical protein